VRTLHQPTVPTDASAQTTDRPANDLTLTAQESSQLSEPKAQHTQMQISVEKAGYG